MLKSKLSSPLFYLLIFILAICLAHLTWQLISLSSNTSADSSFLNTSNFQPRNSNSHNSANFISTIISSNLFGSPAKVKTTNKPKTVLTTKKLQNTKLNLRLTGLIQGEKSVAVIVYKGKQGAYAPDEFIVNNNRLKVQLASVHLSYVIIINNGVEERLNLPKLKQNSNAQNGIILNTSRSLNSNQTNAVNKSLQVNLNSSVFKSILGPVPKATITSNPMSLAKFMQISPRINNGDLKGYAIAAGPDKRLMERSGIQAGDVVTHVNGETVASLNVASLYQKLLTNNSFNLTIDRNGSIITMDIKL